MFPPLSCDMVDRLRVLAAQSEPRQISLLASYAYYGQGVVSVPAAWLVEIIDRMDRAGLPAS